MYLMYDVMEILRQVIQLLILMGCGVGVVYLILVLRDLQKFLNRAADLGIQSMEKICDEIDHLDEMVDDMVDDAVALALCDTQDVTTEKERDRGIS